MINYIPEFILKLGKDIYDIYIRTSMNDQKENDLMLTMSPIIKHQIDVEDDNRKFDHDNKYESCCIRSDKRALIFFTQAIFS